MLELQCTGSESGAPTIITQIASTFCDKNFHKTCSPWVTQYRKELNRVYINLEYLLTLKHVAIYLGAGAIFSQNLQFSKLDHM